MNARRSSLSRPLRARRIRLVAGTGVLALAALSLSACGDDGSAAADGKVNAVASFYPMEFLLKEIGGKHVSVTELTEPGVEPHDLELSPKQVGQLGEAELVVYLKGLQPAVDKAVEQSDVKHVAEATSYTSLEKHGTSEHGEEGHKEEGHGGHEEEGHGEEGHGEEGHEGEGHGGHEEEGHKEEEAGGHEGHDHSTEGGEDPHIWLDPSRYAKVAEGVGKQLAKADPDHKAAYEKNTAALVKRLTALDTEFKDGLRSRTSDTFITTHSAFGYLADRYGLHEEGISGVDPESGSVSGAHMKELHKIAEEDDVSTVFFESNASDKTAQTLARDLKLKTGVLSPLESVKDPAKDDYFSVMKQNLQALRTALGAK
ncbi:zinc ABC transporter substrate-binding protein [Streptomyces armeniacus]|uniref:Zinc ABC transporter substrate-binding protein n=2 Tax=Streptomyces armeniacus TaxID=83291 RepID=A0A345XSE4_9ACTN|nr:metal ABC transporter substrate-binding protein [Streptomyces armeniacus]AXK34560.1 zinc ABC transporter substrate-binding protein [Streptomyces armeniacus]